MLQYPPPQVLQHEAPLPSPRTHGRQPPSPRGLSLCCTTQGGFTSMFQEVGDDMILLFNVLTHQASVMFPDYGNSETVKCKDLRQLPDRFYTVPFQVRILEILEITTL